MNNKRFVVVLAVLLMLAAIPAAVAETASTTIAVMPFRNVCKDASFDWLGYGFAETLGTKLCMVHGIQYVERTDLSKAIRELKLQDTALVDPATASKLGKIVGAKYMIVGSYQKVGSNLKVDARVVDVETSVAKKSADDTGTMSGVFDLEASLAIKLVAALGMAVPESTAQAIAKPATESLSAYEWCSKGDQALESGNAEEAIVDYNKAVSIKPDYADAQYFLGHAYFWLERFQEAANAYKQAIRIKPDYANAHYFLGHAYEGLERYQEAIDAYKQAIQLKPDYANAYCFLGDAYVHLKRYVEAADACKEAIRIKPDYADAYCRLGIAYIGLERFQEAANAYKQAIRIKPDDAVAHLCLGLVNLALGDKGSALDEYKILKNLDPGKAKELFGDIYK